MYNNVVCEILHGLTLKMFTESDRSLIVMGKRDEMKTLGKSQPNNKIPAICQHYPLSKPSYYY